MQRLPQSELCLRILQLAAVMLSLLSSALPMWLQAQQPPLNASSRQGAALRLSPGDVIELSVYNVPDLNTKVRIGSDGDVYLPLINYVHLGGLTAEEAQSLIQKQLSDEGFLKDPHVSVLVDEYSSGGISVLGEVAKPAVYPVRGQQHLFDLISAAGGLTEKAGRSLSVAHRGSDSTPVTVPLSRNLADHPESNVQVYAGDTIIVM
jgi:polysaccharide biosynthesis/export protein